MIKKTKNQTSGMTQFLKPAGGVPKKIIFSAEPTRITFLVKKTKVVGGGGPLSLPNFFLLSYRYFRWIKLNAMECRD